MRIAMIGTRGVPARYGGFETCLEEVGARLVDRGHDVTVYCRDTGPVAADDRDDRTARPPEHRGMRLVWLPAMRRKTLETLSHTALSVGHALLHRPDAAFVFNAANAPLLPLLRARGIPFATHVDGLEWKRAKWSGLGARYYRTAEAVAVRTSPALIADAVGIQDYYTRRFGARTDHIAYGAPVLDAPGSDGLDRLALEPHAYHLVVARFEPENHVDMAVRAFRRSGARHPLVVVGSAPYADAHTARIRELAADDVRVRLLGPVWDQRLLDQLYANALTYVHGHSVGGTNPSLLRAMGAGAATSAFDVCFNREVLGEHGRYFSGPDELARLCAEAEADPRATVRRGQEQIASLDRYTWHGVADRYEALAARLAGISTAPHPATSTAR